MLEKRIGWEQRIPSLDWRKHRLFGAIWLCLYCSQQLSMTTVLELNRHTQLQCHWVVFDQAWALDFIKGLFCEIWTSTHREQLVGLLIQDRQEGDGEPTLDRHTQTQTPTLGQKTVYVYNTCMYCTLACEPCLKADFKCGLRYLWNLFHLGCWLVLSVCFYSRHWQNNSGLPLYVKCINIFSL